MFEKLEERLEDACLNSYMLEMANIREQCSWVHMDEPALATQKCQPWHQKGS